MSPSSRMDANTVASSYRGTLFSSENEHTIATHHNLDGSHKRNVERKKNMTYKRMLSVVLAVSNSKSGKTNLFR